MAYPAPEAAVGPDAVVAMSSQEIGIFTKAGVLLAFGRIGTYPSQPPGIFPTHLGSAVEFPEVLYDVPANSPRYWMTATAGPAAGNDFRGQLCLSASNAGPFWGYDPWLFSYVISLPDPPFPPSIFGLNWWQAFAANIAVDEESVYVNAFVGEYNAVLGQTWKYRNITFIYPKAPVMAGGALPAPEMIIEPAIGSPHANAGIPERAVYDALANSLSYDANVPQYMIRPRFHEADSFNILDLSYIDMTGADPVKADFVAVLPSAATYRIPVDVPQRPGAPTLKTSDARFWAPPIYRDGYLWATHHVRGAPGPLDAERTVVRWYKFAMNGWGPNCPGCTPTLAAWGEIDPGGDQHAAFPSIGVDSLGRAAITYTRFGPLEDPSIRMARTVDPAFPFAIDEHVKDSVHPWSMNGFWGVQTSCDADPSVPGRFWGHGEFVMDQIGDPTPGFQHWRTWIAPKGP